MKKIYKIFILGCLALMASEVKAQDKKDLFNPVNYAVISQTIAPDARGGGLGDIGAATDPDVNSQYWNPNRYPVATNATQTARIKSVTIIIVFFFCP